MKFGGSSLANAERIDYVAKLIKSQIEKGYRPTVVCSAMGKTTNNLLNAGSFALEGNVGGSFVIIIMIAMEYCTDYRPSLLSSLPGVC